MNRVVAVVLVPSVVLIGGCNAVFGLDKTVPIDAAPFIDAPDAPPPRCASGADPTRLVFPAVADTILSSAATTQNYGPLAVATIGSDLGPTGSHGLFRFQIGAIEASAVLELQLVLPSAMKSDDCGTNCGACAAIERPGTMHAYPVRSDWVELEATWMRASASVNWETPGAAGPTDRGDELVPAPEHVVSGDTAFVAAPGSFASIFTWKNADRLSFVVTTDLGAGLAKQVVRSRENSCDGGASPARLEILECP